MTLAELRSVLAPPHPAGRPFILGGAAVALIGLFVGAWLFWLGLLFALAGLLCLNAAERTRQPEPALGG